MTEERQASMMQDMRDMMARWSPAALRAALGTAMGNSAEDSKGEQR